MITIIVKGTNGCNMACSYCSLGEKKNFQFADKEHLKKLFTYSCEFARYRKQDAINFILHGGEPTLIDADIYEECIQFLKIKYPELKIKISMQSNGLIITDSFIRVIKNNDIHIGISIDGSQKIHDLERRTENNKPSYSIVTKNIDKLLRAGVPVSCLMVLTKNAWKDGFHYLSFFEERGLHLKINPLLCYGEAQKHPELALAVGDYANYLIQLYEYIIKKNVNIVISPIDKILRGIIYDQGISECSFRKECNQNFLCIDYKGGIYPCGKFSDMDEFYIGNINKELYGNIDNFLKNNLYGRRNFKIPNQCKACKYLNLCNGGCSAEAAIDGNFNGIPILCKDYRLLFDYFYGDGLKLLKEELVKQKRVLEEYKK